MPAVLPLWIMTSGCVYLTEADRRARYDLDGDGVERPEDCDDGDARIGGAGAWLWDADGDGYGRDDAIQSSCSPPPGYVAVGGDCDDGSAATFPGAAEICDGADNDCDGSPDDGLIFVDYWPDGDGDGYGDASADPVAACGGPTGNQITNNRDCDDTDPWVNPSQLEAPGDEIDEDCDGSILCFVDGDGDGYGDISGATVVDGSDLACRAQDQEALLADDCDDADPTVVPDMGSCVNTPPVAQLVGVPGVGEPSAPFALDASASSDAEAPDTFLEFRWDWESDGTFDTPFVPDPAAVHAFGAAGVYEVTVEVRDPGHRSGFASVPVVVADPGRLLLVDSPDDDGHAEPYGGPYTDGLTLREALILANSTPGADVIGFTGPATVAPASRLPAITDTSTRLVGLPGVVLDGGPGGVDGGVTIEADDALVLGLEIVGFADQGIRIHSGTGSTIRSCTIHDNARFAIQIDAGAPDNTVGPGNEIYGQSERQIKLDAPGAIVGNRLRGPVGPDTSHVRIEASDVLIAGNRIEDASRHGVRIAGGQRIVFTDNTVIGNADQGLRIVEGAGEVQVFNNLFVDNGAWGIDASSTELAPGSPDFNAYHDNGQGPCSACPLGAGAVLGDPGLVDPGAGDLRLLPGSPCIDAGTDAILFDRNGTAPGLYHGAAPDIGALERP